MPSSSILSPVSSSALYCCNRQSRAILSAASPSPPLSSGSFFSCHSQFSLLSPSPTIRLHNRHVLSFSLARRLQLQHQYTHHHAGSFGPRCFHSLSSVQAIDGLPSTLADIVKLFQSVPEPRAKYEQLLHYGKKLQPLPKEYQTLENKVQGCVSQVWVRASIDADKKVHFQAESDSLLTKGLAALLVEGLSGHLPADILRVPPDFIQMLGLNQSLTPSRSNGFLNMLKLMQKKALELSLQSEGVTPKPESSEVRGVVYNMSDAAGADHDTTSVLIPDTTSVLIPQSEDQGESKQLGNRQQRILEKLENSLEPVVLDVQDVSYQHAGHAGVGRGATETHFNLKIVSPKFEGITLVKRHRLVYDLLQEELQSGLHALSIVAKTPAEADRK